MGNVVTLERTVYVTGVASCLECCHEWTAVVQMPAAGPIPPLECGKCGVHSGFMEWPAEKTMWPASEMTDDQIRLALMAGFRSVRPDLMAHLTVDLFDENHHRLFVPVFRIHPRVFGREICSEIIFTRFDYPYQCGAKLAVTIDRVSDQWHPARTPPPGDAS